MSLGIVAADSCGRAVRERGINVEVAGENHKIVEVVDDPHENVEVAGESHKVVGVVSDLREVAEIGDGGYTIGYRVVLLKPRHPASSPTVQEMGTPGFCFHPPSVVVVAE